jgi:acetyl esterase/lipase
MLRVAALIALTSLVALAGCSPEESESGAPTDAADAQVEIVTDVVYGHKLGMALTLDVLRPRQANGAGIVFLNSAGYVSPGVIFVADSGTDRTLRTDEELGPEAMFSFRPLLESGYTVFNVRHGSSPRFRVPEIVDDVRRAIRFIRASSGEFGVDPERLGLWGGSAGGHLALMLGIASEVAPETEDETPAMPARVAAVVAYFPPSDFATERIAAEKWTRANYGEDLLTSFPAADFPEERDPEFSPVTYASSDDPPTLIIHGDQDNLVPLVQGQMMHDALSTAGALSELIVIEGAGHFFGAEDAEMASRQMLEWFGRHLR